MIYEVRTYTLRPGTVGEFESRFEKRHPYREHPGLDRLGRFFFNCGIGDGQSIGHTRVSNAVSVSDRRWTRYRDAGIHRIADGKAA